MLTPDNLFDDTVHWLVYNIPVTSTGIAQGALKNSTVSVLPSGTVNQGKNYKNLSGYDGPAPPTGVTHNYHFALVAIKDATVYPADQNIWFFASILQDKTKIAGQVELKPVFTGK